MVCVYFKQEAVGSMLASLPRHVAFEIFPNSINAFLDGVFRQRLQIHTVSVKRSL